MTKQTITTLVLSNATIALLVLAGCTTPATNKPKERSFPSLMENPLAKKEPEFKQPHRMAIVWRDAVYTEPGQQSTRGFGGRVYFYDEDNQPVKVDGELTVFGYDDSNESAQSKVANRKFVYEGKHLEHYFRDTDLGPSYDVWIPWDAVGGDRKNISLVPIFRTGEGQLLKGEMARNILPGKKPVTRIERIEEGIASRESNSSIRPITYRNQRQPSSIVGTPGTTVSFGERPKMQTTTIPVPPSLGRQLKAPQSVPSQPAAESMNSISYGDRPNGWYSPSASSFSHNRLSRNGTDGAQQRVVFGSPGALPSRPNNRTVSSNRNSDPQSQVQAGLVGSPNRIRYKN